MWDCCVLKLKRMSPYWWQIGAMIFRLRFPRGLFRLGRSLCNRVGEFLPRKGLAFWNRERMFRDHLREPILALRGCERCQWLQARIRHSLGHFAHLSRASLSMLGYSAY